MSDEAESVIQDVFIDKLSARFPLVKVDARDVAAYGITAYPSVYCIDATGAVHSVPADHMPSEAMIEELLQAVTIVPKMPADSRYDPVRSMWYKKDFAKLRDHLGTMLAQPNLDAAMREVYEAQQQALDKKAEAQSQRVVKLGLGPDYFSGSAQLARIEKEWKGFPVAAAARQELNRFAGDADIRKEIAAGKALAKLMGSYDPGKLVQARKLQEELGKFAKKYAGTFAGQQAQKRAGG